MQTIETATKRLHYVDTLRFCASTAVLAQHLFEHVDRWGFDPFLRFAPGIYGVVLFFYLSGLSMPLSVRSNPPLKAFLLRRVFRIYPAYLACLLLVLALAAMGMEEWASVLGRLSPSSVAANLLLIQEWVGSPSVLGVTWTLSLEFFWYGVFALIFYVSGNHRAAVITDLYSVALLALALLSVLLERRLPLGRVAMVGAAMIGYLTAQRQDELISGRKLASSVALFVFATGAGQVVSFGYFTHPTTPLMGGLVAWTAATLTFFLFAIPRSIREGRISASAPVLFLGTISYSVYLTHSIVISVLDLVVSGTAMLVLAPLLTMLLSWLMFEGIERRGIRLGRLLEMVLLPTIARGPQVTEAKTG